MILKLTSFLFVIVSSDRFLANEIIVLLIFGGYIGDLRTLVVIPLQFLCLLPFYLLGITLEYLTGTKGKND